MYITRLASRLLVRKDAILFAMAFSLPVLFLAVHTPSAAAQQTALSSGQYNPSIIRKISGLSERLELTTNSSRILTLDKKIPRVQVNNPELLDVTPLSDREISVSAKFAGVTQINLWDEDGKVHTVDVLIYGDAQELEHALQIQFPHSSIKVYRYSESLVLKGFVDRPDVVSQIMRLAEDYAPKVVNNITVGGVQQVLLKVKIMEVSRTKLRDLGVDWAHISGSGVITASSVSGLITEIAQQTGTAAAITPNVEGGPGIIDNLGNFQFGIVDGRDVFFGFLSALQQNNVAKVLAEPNLVAVSGRPAQFNNGGEIPILVPQSLGTVSIQYRPYGTQVDFLPVVLGNGNIRLEVRSKISDLDPANGVLLEDFQVPAFKSRWVDTAVEMKAGQTFALAGLIQERVDAISRGLPYLADIPVFGVPFRRVEETINEIELLIMVTPEFVDAMDPYEVPCGGPGLDTVSPTNKAFYIGGHLEVPAHCNPIRGPGACNNCGPGAPYGGGANLPGGSGYDVGDYYDQPVESVPAGEALPAEAGQGQQEPSLPPADGSTSYTVPPARSELAGQTVGSYAPSAAARTYSPTRVPVYLRNAVNPQNQHAERSNDASTTELPALIGPVGYDVQ